MIDLDVAYSSDVDSFADIEKLLQNYIDSVRPCRGTEKEGGIRSEKCSLFLEPSGVKKRIPPRCHQCAEKKKSLARKVRRGLQQKIGQAKKKIDKNNKIRRLIKKVFSRNKKIIYLKDKVEGLKARCADLEQSKINDYIKDWPTPWKNAVLACVNAKGRPTHVFLCTRFFRVGRPSVNASRVKSTKGRRYTTQWIYECQLLRIRSLSLYKKMLRDGFLPFPSLGTLLRYMKKLSPAYVLKKNTFATLKKKISYNARVC
ncbi:Sodium channel protein type 3 subunit alpha [Frankliniella fusca]|uniref:Sodium channel protein type 3 subunit alpha n=1 Tax=Frankliniella fusca TaxID=407009 RepID=A0AAE1LT18_9NEOP|nr:Sodium channel protein type 3 subunit alpha [Frankliniella fusca]